MDMLLIKVNYLRIQVLLHINRPVLRRNGRLTVMTVKPMTLFALEIVIVAMMATAVLVGEVTVMVFVGGLVPVTGSTLWRWELWNESALFEGGLRGWKHFLWWCVDLLSTGCRLTVFLYVDCKQAAGLLLLAACWPYIVIYWHYLILSGFLRYTLIRVHFLICTNHILIGLLLQHTALIHHNLLRPDLSWLLTQFNILSQDHLLEAFLVYKPI